MHIPIVVVVQANRGGVVDKNSKDTPELEAIRDSDGIAQNATIVYAMRQLKNNDGETVLIIDNKKMRGGEVGKSYKYKWNVNVGKFEHIDDFELADSEASDKREVKELTGGSKRTRKTDVEDDF
jgi:hypothetical protein